MGVKKEIRTKWKNIIHLFIPYSICVIVPILAILLLGTLMMDSYEDKMEDNTQDSIEQAFEQVQIQLDSIEYIATYIGNSELIEEYSFATVGNRTLTVEDYQEIMNMLKLLEVSSDVMEIYLYDSKENRIISTDAMLSNAAYYFRYRYPVVGMTAEECLERLDMMSDGRELHEIVQMAVGGGVNNVIEYSVKVPFGMEKIHPLRLVILMKSDDILEPLSDIVGTEGEFYVYDRSGRMLISKGDQHEAYLKLTEETTLTKLSNKETPLYGAVLYSWDEDYKLKVYIPNLHDDRSESFYILLVMLISTLVCLVLCIFFTIKNQREIDEILALFGYRNVDIEPEKYTKRFYGYVAIKQNVDKLVRDNAVLLEQNVQMNELTKHQVLYKLLHDESREMQKNSCDIGTELKDDKNLVLCIRYESADYRNFIAEDVTVKDFVKMFIKEMIDREVEMFDPSAKETVCIVYGVEQDYADILMRDVAARLNTDIFYAGGITAVMGISEVVGTIYSLNVAYKQAKEVIRYRKITGKNVLLYSDLRYLSDECYYPKDFDELLSNYLLAGKLEEANKLLDKIYKENVIKKLLTIDALDKIKRRLTECLSLLAGQYDVQIQEIAMQLKEVKNLEDYFSLLRLMSTIIVEGICQKKNVMEETTVTRILNYIHANYADSSLSLTIIAHELGFQKDYISKLFKAEYGENLSVILEKIRIEKACELLRETDIRIVDVAEAVGYNSDISFRRAFKKVTGLTPVEYKNLDRR